METLDHPARAGNPYARVIFGSIFAVALLTTSRPMTDYGNVAASYRTSSTFGISDDFSYGLLQPGKHTVSGNTNGRSWKVVQHLLETEAREVFWFRIEDRDYVVRDRATIDRVRERLAPMASLTAISRARDFPLPSIRLATLQQAISRTIETSPNSDTTTMR